MAHHVIRKVRLAHCKLGPTRCEKCRELDAEKICLLEIDPEGEMQRRVIQLHDEGTWHEFEILTTFATGEEARTYAARHGIEDVTF
jgi:hypothetical protein